MIEERELCNTTDASIWAKAFVERFGGDEGNMLGWFANAIETAKAEAHQHQRALKDALASGMVSNVRITLNPPAGEYSIDCRTLEELENALRMVS